MVVVGFKLPVDDHHVQDGQVDDLPALCAAAAGAHLHLLRGVAQVVVDGPLAPVGGGQHDQYVPGWGARDDDDVRLVLPCPQGEGATGGDVKVDLADDRGARLPGMHVLGVSHLVAGARRRYPRHRLDVADQPQVRREDGAHLDQARARRDGAGSGDLGKS